MTSPEDDQVLTQIKQYRLVRELGRGGMGVVHEAIDTRDGSRVAVKMLHPWLASGDASFRERFEREAHIAALLRSPYSVRLVDFGIAGSTYFLVMEFVEGTTLAQRLEAGPLDPASSLRIAIDVARALEEAGTRSVVHRDIKPENILLTPDGRVKVADFGIARHEGGTGLTVAGGFVGTPDFASPEQAGGETDHRSDVYSLGATLYCMLAGHPPFTGATAWEVMSQHQSADLPIEPLAGLPNSVVNPVRRCLEKDPRDRYQSASELAAALERALAVYQRGRSGGGARFGGSGAAPGGARPISPDEARTPPTEHSVPATPPPAIGITDEPTRISRQEERGSPTRVSQGFTAPPLGQFTPAGAPPARGEVPIRASRHRGPVVAIVAAISVAAIGAVIGIVVLNSGGGGSAAQGATPAAPSPTAASPASATSNPASANPATAVPATPAPSVILTATRPPPTVVTQAVLPTPVLPGFPVLALPATSPDREIVDLINRNGPAYARALNERNEAYLTGIFTGEALSQFTQDVVKERAKPPTQNAMLSIQLVSSNHTDTTASVTTKERWRVQSAAACTLYDYDELYALTFVSGQWLVAQDKSTQTGTSPC